MLVGVILIVKVNWKRKTCSLHYHFYKKANLIEMTTCNHFHNILRLFDVVPNFPFTTSETKRDYYLQTWYIRVASLVTK